MKQNLMLFALIYAMISIVGCSLNCSLNEENQMETSDIKNETTLSIETSSYAESTVLYESEASVYSETLYETEKTPETNEANESLQNETDEIILETEPPIETAELFVFCDKEVISYEEFDFWEEHDLSYIQYRPNGSVKNANAIQEPLLYTDEHFYYSEYYDGYAVMNVYNMRENAVVGSFQYPFVILDPVYLEVSDNFFMAPCYYGENGELRMIALNYQISGNSINTVFDIEVSSPNVDIEKVDENTVLFFVYRNVQGVMVDTIYLYNLSQNTVSLFYESFDADWTDPKLTTKNIRLVETFHERIYILFDQMIENQIHNYLEVYNIKGDLIESYSLSCLEPYGIEQCRVNKMICFHDYVYFDFSKSNQSQTLTDYILLRKNDDHFEEIKLEEYSPNRAIFDDVLYDKYIMLASSNEQYDLLVININQNTLTPIGFGFGLDTLVYPYNIFCNSNGELMIITEDSNKYQKIMIHHFNSN